MTFIMENYFNLQHQGLRNKIKRIAKYRVYLYKHTAKEEIIDNFLQQNYKKSLIDSCLYLINKSNIYVNKDKEYIIKITDPNDDKLARIITYGNGYFLGSNILKQAFK